MGDLLTAEEWLQRHDAKIVVVSESGCWIWTASLDYQGYGQVASPFHPPRDRTPWKAHRASYVVLRGEIPQGLWVRHRCDVRACVNPDHLEIGTPLDNAADMVARNLQSRGSHRWAAKLTEEKVAEIRSRYARGELQSALGGAFGVGSPTISNIVRRKTWKHVA